MNGLPRTVVVMCVITLLGAGSAQGQDRRALIQQAVDEFDPDAAIGLLRTALDPQLGPPDSLWGVGAQAMAERQLELGRDSLAAVWLRWALRLDPDMVPDTLGFGPDVVGAFNRARAAVGDDVIRGDPPAASTTVWQWSVDPDGPTGFRLAFGSNPAGLAAFILGEAALTPGQDTPREPGTYVIQAQATGFDTLRIAREILPGVTTVVSFDLRVTEQIAQEPPPDSLLADGVEATAMRSLVAITGTSLLGDSWCGTGYLASSDGLIVTTYRSIRGAETARVRFVDGTEADAEVAAWDVTANVAVVRAPGGPADSLTGGSPAEVDDWTWTAAHPGCGEAELARRRVADRDGGRVGFALPIEESGQGGVIIDREGGVVGLGTGEAEGLGVEDIGAVLEAARANVDAAVLTAVGRVAEVERHRVGAFTLSSTEPGAVARVTPLESWQWAELAGEQAVPWRYVGAEGAYRYELVVADSVVVATDFTVVAGGSGELALDVPDEEGGGGGGAVVVAVLLVGGAAAGVAFLLGGGDSTVVQPPPPGKGTIEVIIPSIIRHR